MNYNYKGNDEYDACNTNKLIEKGDEVFLYEFNGLGFRE